MLSLEFTNKLVDIACKQYDASVRHKKNRMDDIAKSEEFYYSKKRKVLKGQFAIPFPLMSGFVDTLKSKIDDAPIIEYGHEDLADYKRAMILNAAWKKDSAPIRGDWAQVDRWTKFSAIFSGRGINKIFAESLPKYRTHFKFVDYMAFHSAPMGGGELENHMFCGEEDVFLTKKELEDGAREGIYDKVGWAKLIRRTGEDEYKRMAKQSQSRLNRYKLLGLNVDDGEFLGQPVFNLMEWFVKYDGKRYYLLFNYETKVAVRAEELKEVMESDLWPYTSWATHEDGNIFWSKAPADDMRPVCESFDVMMNQEFENRYKRGTGMRGYDPEMIEEPGELQWGNSGLVQITVPPNKKASDGIFNFETPALSGTVELLNFTDRFFGVKTGVNPEGQGAPETDQKVGVYFGNLQQMADRIGTINKSYKNAYNKLGLRYYYGLREHLNEKMMVKLIGEKGVEWQEINKADIKGFVHEPNIDVTSVSSDTTSSELTKKGKQEGLMFIAKTPTLAGNVSPRWVTQNLLANAGYDEEEIKSAMDVDGAGNIETLSEAHQAIQDIINGKSPKLNRGADTMFIQHIIDYATDKEVDADVYKKLMTYAGAHIPIARLNKVREVRMKQAAGPKTEPLRIGENVETEEPTPENPAPTGGRSATTILKGGAQVAA